MQNRIRLTKKEAISGFQEMNKCMEENNVRLTHELNARISDGLKVANEECEELRQKLAEALKKVKKAQKDTEALRKNMMTHIDSVKSFS